MIGLILALSIASPLFNHSASIHTDRGISALEKGDGSTALKEFSLAESADPGNPVTRYNLGLSLIKLKEYEGAHAQFKSAGELSPTPELAESLQYHRGLSSFEAGEAARESAPDRAKAFYEASRKEWVDRLLSHPEDEVARAYLELTLRRLSDAPPPQENKEKDSKKEKNEEKADGESQPNDGEESNSQPKKEKPEDSSSETSEPERPAEISPQEVERILDALEEREREARQSAPGQLMEGGGGW